MPEINDTSLDSELDEILATNGSQNYQVPQSDQYGNMISDQYGNFIANATKSSITDQEAVTVYISSSVGVGLGILYALVNKRGFWAYVGFAIAGNIFGTALGLGIVFATKNK